MRSALAPRTPHPSDEPIGVTRLRPRPEFDRLFDALADVDRLRLLEELDLFSGTAAKLASKLGWTRDSAAKQLKLLERAGLVAGARIGRRVFYTRTSANLTAALGWSFDLWSQLPTAEFEPTEMSSLEKRAVSAGALRAAGRRDMLECMCRGGPITQGAAAQDCGLSQGLASRGLAQLVGAGLVTVRTTRPPHRYIASPETMAAMVGWLRTAAEAAARAEAQERRLQEARAARAAERRRSRGVRARLEPSAESPNLPPGMGRKGMTGKRPKKRGRQVSPPEIRKLDGFFAVFGDEEGCKLASAVCRGVVTGADLSDELGWPRDKVSRRLSLLEKAGIIEKRRDGPRVRATPILAGVVSAQAWIEMLRAEPAPGVVPDTDPQARRRRNQMLADRTRRDLLTQIGETSGATQVQLIRECGLSQPVASRGLARLVEEGFVDVRRASGSARYVLRAEAVEDLWGWSERAKAKLAAGRTTALRKVLTDRTRCEPPDAKEADVESRPALIGDAATLSTAQGGERDARDPEPMARLRDPGAANTVPTKPEQAHAILPATRPAKPVAARAPSPPVSAALPPTMVAPPPKPSFGAVASLRAPRPPLTKIAHSLDAEDLRPGQCFECKDGALILLLSHVYGEMTYARSGAGDAKVTTGQELRHRLVAGFSMAVDPAAFPRERIPR